MSTRSGRGSCDKNLKKNREDKNLKKNREEASKRKNRNRTGRLESIV